MFPYHASGAGPLLRSVGKNYGRARKLIIAQLEDLSRGRIGAEEAKLASGVLLSAVRGMRDSPGAIIDFGLEARSTASPPTSTGCSAS